MEKKIWFITGTSKGLGLELVKTLLAKGYRVAATSRKPEELKSQVSAGPDQLLALAVDLLNEKSVAAAIKATVDQFGGIDVIVNNAGYGMLGAIEELTDAEAQQNFDVNVFGSLNVLRQAIPYLRKQGSGHILNVSSIGGFSGLFPGFGIYCATKFAVQGFSESLSAELKPFGIHTTIVSPGYFRTDFLSQQSLSVPGRQMPEYANVREIQAIHQDSYHHQQPGDPVKAAIVMIDVVESEAPPLHLFLGQDAYALADQKIALVKKDMDQVRAAATSTAFDN